MPKGVLVLALLLVAGCGCAIRDDEPEPIARHLVYEKVTGEKGIWIADADGLRPRLLVRDGHEPTISPDGKWVAYFDDCSKSSRRCSLYVTRTSASEPKLLAPGYYEEFSWSASSDRIAATRTPDDEVGLVAALVNIDVPSAEEATLTEGSLYGWSFSPDGDQIVFAVARNPGGEGFNGDEVDLFVASRDSGDAKQITRNGDSGYPVWGPNSIVFAKLIPHRGWGRHELWEIQPDGSNRRPLVSPLPKRFLGQGYVGLVPVDWSDDGRALLAGWLNEWGRIPVAVEPDTGSVRQLAEGFASEAVALSRNGQLALVETIDNAGSNPASNTVLIARYAGGKPRVVANGATGASWNR